MIPVPKNQRTGANSRPLAQFCVLARLSGEHRSGAYCLYVSSGAHRKRSQNQKSAGVLPGRNPLPNKYNPG